MTLDCPIQPLRLHTMLVILFLIVLLTFSILNPALACEIPRYVVSLHQSPACAPSVGLPYVLIDTVRPTCLKE